MVDSEAFLRHTQNLMRLIDQERLPPPDFAVAPDLIGAGQHSLRFSARERKKLARAAPELRWYLAAQDGCEPDQLGLYAEGFSGLFLAGSDPWKRHRAGEFQHAARLLSWECHWARCSTGPLMRLAHTLGFDSADSSAGLHRTGDLVRLLETWVEL